MSRKTRKLIWAAPLVAVFAVAGALALFMTLTPSQTEAQAEEIPGMPMNLTSNALGPDSIELMWDAPTADAGGLPDGYRIDYSDDGMVWYSLEPNHNSTVFTDDTGLSAVQTRHYRVFAFNSGGSSAVLNGKSAVTEKSTKADAPTALTAAGGTPAQTEIALTWTAPSNPPGAPVTKYLIEVSKDGRAFTKLVERSAKDAGCTGPDTSCEYTHSGLLESQERWYRVTAYNHPNGKHAAAVASNASNTDSHTTTVGVIPAAIAAGGVRVGLNPAGRMTLYWDEPDTSAGGTPLPGAPIIGYYVYGGNAATAATDVRKLHFVEANTSLAITSNIQNKFDVPSATEDWNFQVMAVNSVVRRGVADGVVTAGTDGNWSTNVAVTAADRAKNETEEPDNVTNDLLNRPRFTKRVRVNNVNAGRTNIELIWVVEKVQDTTAYRLERSEDRIDWENVALGTNTDETLTDTNRVAGTTYWYRVLSRHNRSISDANVFTEASTPVSVTTAPAGRPLAPVLDSVVSSSETQIDVTWTPPDDVVGTPPDAGAAGSPAVGHGKITGYEVDVSDDGKTWSLLATVAGKLDEEYTYDEKTMKVTVKKEDAADTEVEFFHKGLVQGETKYYRVSTLNNAPSSSKRSVTSAVMNDMTLLSLVSDSPGGLIAKAKDSSSIEIVWNARADDITAAPIIGYKIESSPLNAAGDDCAEDWSVLEANTMSTTTSYTDTGLMPETGRCYRVFGINVVATSSGFVGYGDDYVTTNDNDAIATTHAAPANMVPTKVGTISNMTVAVGESTAAMDVSGYFADADTDDTLTYTAMSSMTSYATADIPTGSNMLTITGVAAGTATITVTASDGTASVDQTFMVTVEADTEPMELMAPRITGTNPVGSGIILVSWNAVDGATGYSLIATNLSDPSAPTRTAAADADDRSGQIQNLAAGAEYLIFVAAFNDDLTFKISDYVRVTTDP